MRLLRFFRSFFLFCIAFVTVKLTKNAEKSEYVLLGCEYGKLLDDNADSLVKGLKKERIPFFLILDDLSLTSYPALKRGGFNSYIAFFQCRGVFYTHSLSDILPELQLLGRLASISTTAPLIFIQHGVVGLKVDDVFKRYLKRNERCFDYIIASTQNETKILEQLGVPARKIKMCGLPRFDSIEMSNHKKFLAFLTWGDKKSYSRKEAEIKNAITNANIEKFGYEFVAVKHVMMGKQCGSEVECLSLSDQINESNILITDNSSVAWDYWYAGKAVIFFKPEPHFHISCRKLVEGRVAYTCDTLCELVVKEIHHRSYMPHINWKYHDSKNAKRVIELLGSMR